MSPNLNCYLPTHWCRAQKVGYLTKSSLFTKVFAKLKAKFFQNGRHFQINFKATSLTATPMYLPTVAEIGLFEWGAFFA